MDRCQQRFRVLWMSWHETSFIDRVPFLFEDRVTQSAEPGQ